MCSSRLLALPPDRIHRSPPCSALIPGVGAMYNGQYFKGLLHVVIFVVIISITTHYGLFGLFIPAWILYQAFEAFHTAKAIRDGQPLPGSAGPERGRQLGQPRWTPASARTTGSYRTARNARRAAPGLWSGPGSRRVSATATVRAVSGSVCASSAAGIYRPGHAPRSSRPAVFWRRKEPIGALILIGFGLLLLVDQLGFLAERFVHILWPLIFIALGAWLVVRRLNDTPPQGPPPPGRHKHPAFPGG